MDADNQTPPIQFLEKNRKSKKIKNEKNPPESVKCLATRRKEIKPKIIVFRKYK